MWNVRTRVAARFRALLRGVVRCLALLLAALRYECGFILRIVRQKRRTMPHRRTVPRVDRQIRCERSFSLIHVQCAVPVTTLNVAAGHAAV